MAEMKLKEIAPDIFCIEPLLRFNRARLLVGFIRAGGGVLIDPGPSSLAPDVDEAMKRLGMKTLEYIIPTHIHLDHGGAAGRLAALFPDARVVLHPEAVRHMVDPSRLIRGTMIAFGDDFQSKWGTIEAVPESRILVPADGETISLDGRMLQVVHTPGHAQHHICILDVGTRGLFCGEALGLRWASSDGKVFTMPSAIAPNFDMALYLESHQKLRKLEPGLLFYAHHGVEREPARAIDVASANTRLFGDVVARGMARGATRADIVAELRAEISAQVSSTLDAVSLDNVTAAYMTYLKSRQGQP